MADFIFSLDQCAASSRAIVFDHGGQVVIVAQNEFKKVSLFRVIFPIQGRFRANNGKPGSMIII
jgi:glycerol kinase